MPTQQEIDARKGCRTSLERMQLFKTETLSREDELGRELNFQEAVPAATRLVMLYSQISSPVLDDLPERQLSALKTQADADFNRFEQITKFSSKQPDAYGVRGRLITDIDNAYQGAFNTLHPIIAYSTSKSADFKRLETEARGMLQSVEDKANGLTRQLEEDKKSAEQILQDIRKTAAEHGVSQTATYFQGGG